MEYDIYLQIGSMLFVALTIFMYFTRQRVDFDTTRYYGGMLFVLEVALFVDIMCVISKANSGGEMTLALNIWARLYVFFTVLCCEVLLNYVLMMVIPKGLLRKRLLWGYLYTLIFMTVCLIAFPMTLENMGGKWHTSSIGMLIALIFCTCYILNSLYLAIKYRKKLHEKFFGIVIFNIVALLSILGQVIFKNHLLIGVAGSLSMVYMYFTFENPDALADPDTGLYYRHTYNMTLERLFHAKKEFVILAVRVTNFKNLVDAFDVDYCIDMERRMGKFLAEASEGNTFRYMDYGYTIIVNDMNKAQIVIERIQTRFAEKWRIGDAEVKLDVCGCYLECPKSAADMNATYEIMRFGVMLALKENKTDFLCVDEKVVAQVARIAKIEKAIDYAIENDTFDVYYQPIYCVSEKRFKTAEALIRLNDPELGYLPPDEFIPIAEENGSIGRVGMIVMEKVCRFIHENKIVKENMRFIEVNLSLVQCMQEDLAEQMVTIMRKYNVDPGMINLELTETSAVKSSEHLIKNMENLIAQGSEFSLDDYGTGYSNINYIVLLPFQIIKLDKTMVWAYEESVKARVVMDHIIGMIKELNFNIIGEGVETREQAQNLISQGVDYLQGFYFSKPLKEADFLELLQKGNNVIEV